MNSWLKSGVGKCIEIGSETENWTRQESHFSGEKGIRDFESCVVRFESKVVQDDRANGAIFGRSPNAFCT